MLSQILDKKAIQDAIGGKPLSDLLDEIDVQLGKLKGAGQQAVKIFLLMDEAYNRVVAAPEDGLKAEKRNMNTSWRRSRRTPGALSGRSVDPQKCRSSATSTSRSPIKNGGSWTNIWLNNRRRTWFGF
jgi:hypothetical protein